MIYFITFCLSGFLFQITNYENNKFKKKVLCFVALMIPVLLSAYRSMSVGTDTGFYAYPVYKHAMNVESFSKLIGYDNIESGFLFLEYVSAKYFGTIAFALGTIQLIIDYCYYKAVKLQFGEKNVATCMMIFYFLIYGGTLNVMRQSVAVALVLLAMLYFSKKRYVLAVLLVGIATLFHSTAGIALVFFLIYLATSRDRLYYATNVVIIASSFAIIFAWNKVIELIFYYVPVWQKSYSDYLKFGKAGERNEVNIICGIITLVILYLTNKRKPSRWNRFLISMMLLFLFYQPLTEKMYILSRILLYPQAFMIFVFPLVKEWLVLKMEEEDVQWLIDLLIIGFFFVIWFYSVVMNNSNSIMPYSFM